jgi:alpha-tubulin suppressor-like RCC1 family protein
VWCWGDNNSGQLGDGTSTRRTRATQVSGLTSVIALSAGATHTCAVRAGGGVLCWGANNARQLGDGTNVSDRRSPTPVIGLPAAAVEIAAGAVHTCARLVDHRVYCWGDNTYGQVNANASEQPQPPTLVPGLN